MLNIWVSIIFVRDPVEFAPLRWKSLTLPLKHLFCPAHPPVPKDLRGNAPDKPQ